MLFFGSKSVLLKYNLVAFARTRWLVVSIPRRLLSLRVDAFLTRVPGSFESATNVTLKRTCQACVLRYRWACLSLALSASARQRVCRFGTLSCLVPALRKKGAFPKMLPSLAKTHRASVCLRSGTELGCGLSRRLKICLLHLGAKRIAHWYNLTEKEFSGAQVLLRSSASHR